MENPIKMDDLGVPLFSETSICSTLIPTLNSLSFAFYKSWLAGGQKEQRKKNEGEEEPVRLVKTSWCPILCEPYQVGKS